MTASPYDDSIMPISLLDRRIDAFADVDRLLRLPHGTARRWIDGYDRTRFGGLVKLDPLHQYGRPVVRAVPTEVVAEQFRAGESAETIARLFDLTTGQVEEALRFELSVAEIA
jgi:uncharacterized protein (DUF433 family)